MWLLLFNVRYARKRSMKPNSRHVSCNSALAPGVLDHLPLAARKPHNPRQGIWPWPWPEHPTGCFFRELSWCSAERICLARIWLRCFLHLSTSPKPLIQMHRRRKECQVLRPDDLPTFSMLLRKHNSHVQIRGGSHLIVVVRIWDRRFRPYRTRSAAIKNKKPRNLQPATQCPIS